MKLCRKQVMTVVGWAGLLWTVGDVDQHMSTNGLVWLVATETARHNLLTGVLVLAVWS